MPLLFVLSMASSVSVDNRNSIVLLHISLSICNLTQMSLIFVLLDCQLVRTFSQISLVLILLCSYYVTQFKVSSLQVSLVQSRMSSYLYTQSVDRLLSADVVSICTPYGICF